MDSVGHQMDTKNEIDKLKKEVDKLKKRVKDLEIAIEEEYADESPDEVTKKLLKRVNSWDSKIRNGIWKSD